MAEIIPEIQLSDFRKLNVEQLRRLKCCEVTAEGEYLFTFVNGNLESSGFLRKNSENRSAATNSIAGETLEQVMADYVPKTRKPNAKKRKKKPELAAVA